MAEPFSVAASAIALTKTSHSCVTLLVDLVKSVQNAPADIQALSNEVVDLKVFFDNVQELCENVDAGNSQQSRFLAAASQPLENARAALSELEGLLKESNSKSFGAKERLKWVRQRGTVRTLRKRFQQIKTELRDVLTLSTAAAS